MPTTPLFQSLASVIGGQGVEDVVGIDKKLRPGSDLTYGVQYSVRGLGGGSAPGLEGSRSPHLPRGGGPDGALC